MAGFCVRTNLRVRRVFDSKAARRGDPWSMEVLCGFRLFRLRHGMLAASRAESHRNRVFTRTLCQRSVHVMSIALPLLPLTFWFKLTAAIAAPCFG